MVEKIDINRPTTPEPIWLWSLRCPGCKEGFTLTMTPSQLESKRILLIRDGDDGFICTDGICSGCHMPSYIKFELSEDASTLVGCVTFNPELQTPMANPELETCPAA